MATSLRHCAPFIGAKYNAFWFAPCRPSCSARNIRAAKSSTKPRSSLRLPEPRAISAAMFCAASEQRKWILRCSGNSPNREAGASLPVRVLQPLQPPQLRQSHQHNTLTSPLFGHSTQMLASFLGSGGANGGFNPSTRSAARARSS